MAANFLDLHIVDFCQLRCKHCYLEGGNNSMPLDMIKDICEDFLQTKFPLPNNNIILSGGDPLLHPNFEEVCGLVRKLNGGHIALSTNGILIPKYISLFKKIDGIQVSIDGDKETHDFIRGKGSYENALKALILLKKHGIGHGIGFTINQINRYCVDNVIDICIKTGASIFNCNIYQPITKNVLQPITFQEWLKIREYISTKIEKEEIHLSSPCIVNGCVGGISGVSVLPDGTYLDCVRNQKVLGKYPQKLNEILYWDYIKNEKAKNQFETCCRWLEYE